MFYDENTNYENLVNSIHKINIILFKQANNIGKIYCEIPV